MRGARWLLLVMIAAILGGVGITYRARKQVLREQAPPKPQPLPPELSSAAGQYHVEHSVEGRKVWEIDADDERQLKDASRVDLKGVTLKLYGKDTNEYDLVKSATATLTTADNRFYSDGDVEITLGVPADGQPKHTLISIKSSGISLDRNSGRAETDRLATFVFQNGEGKATGAYYDPTTRDLVMKKDVELHWMPPGPNAKAMKVEASSATYKESLSEIWLKPWGRLTRGDMVVEGNDDVIRLDKPDGDGKRRIRQVEANLAHGTDAFPNRKLHYAADSLLMDFNDGGEIQKITGSGRAQLVSTSATSETTVKAGRVELNFEARGSENLLALVNASAGSEVQSRPLPAAGRPLSESHILRADAFDLKMRPDGREIETVVTRSPGTLEFLPNQPAQHHRTLEGQQMTIAYGPENRVESFRATNAKTQTEPTAEERKRGRAVFHTSSRDLLARFDSKTSRLASMEQSGDFSYDEGERHARASKATLDSDNIILLDAPARVWDATSSTAADHIRLDQRTGDFTGEGSVRSSRLPDQDQ
ncbi:MAG: LPS export ABC transporter periplasmic protein LptC, partial [Acidobacteriia bacterium]|nr:LPS export ABC transporter periplasmic protein LptC [Terriglobia bacterium]